MRVSVIPGGGKQPHRQWSPWRQRVETGWRLAAAAAGPRQRTGRPPASNPAPKPLVRSDGAGAIRPSRHGLIEHARGWCGGGVAVGGQVAEAPISWNPQACAHRIEDPLVGLVQQQPQSIWLVAVPGVLQAGLPARQASSAPRRTCKTSCHHSSESAGSHRGWRYGLHQGMALLACWQGQALRGGHPSAFGNPARPIVSAKGRLRAPTRRRHAPKQDAGAAVIQAIQRLSWSAPITRTRRHRAQRKVMAAVIKGKTRKPLAGRRQIEGHRWFCPQGAWNAGGRAEEVVGAGGGQQDQIEILRLPSPPWAIEAAARRKMVARLVSVLPGPSDAAAAMPVRLANPGVVVSTRKR